MDLVGIRGALGLAGGLLPIMAVATWPWISRLELESLVPEDRLALLRRVPLFAPLNLSTLERLASAMVPVDVTTGEVLMREGDVGDRYLVIETGTVGRLRAGQPAARRADPATASARSRCSATCRARRRSSRPSPAGSWRSTRMSFKAAMAGPAAWAAAEATIADRLATSAASGAGGRA